MLRDTVGNGRIWAKTTTKYVVLIVFLCGTVVSPCLGRVLVPSYSHRSVSVCVCVCVCVCVPVPGTPRSLLDARCRLSFP